jgi:hypothetical protein
MGASRIYPYPVGIQRVLALPAMHVADASAWIGAILLIGGIVVAFAINPPIGAAVVAVGAAVLWLARRGEKPG